MFVLTRLIPDTRGRGMGAGLGGRTPWLAGKPAGWGLREGVLPPTGKAVSELLIEP
jgi:hypothetical protein